MTPEAETNDVRRNPSAMLTVGERLRQRREAKGLSLEEVSRATKIHVNVLTLIEADRAAGSLNPIYLKGFIKTYGGHLGEDVPSLLAMLPVAPSVPLRLTPPASTRQPSRPPKGGGHVMRAVAERLQHLPWRRLVAAAVVIALAWAAGTRVRAAMSRKAPAAAPARRAAAVPVKPPSKKPAAVVKKQAPPAAPATSAPKKQASTTPATPPVGEQVRLTVRVHAITWMQVKADGSVVFQNALQPGTRETWLARREIALWLGDAGGVSLELNGRPLGVPGKRGEVVRALRITSQGIQR